MTKINEIYKCEICGNIVEINHGGAEDLACCGEEMKILDGNTVDAALEKHVPVIEETEDGVIVKVGDVEHPMVEEHYIEWIEVLFENGNCKKFLKPGDKPEARFKIKKENILEAREHCNLHGLWKK
ncbi:MAG: desulfoferrodoxin [Patescibacteria group bacterium]|jgi:superoxide reductase|nr:desulfoferrodoxin [Patescibacteria group bacterium]